MFKSKILFLIMAGVICSHINASPSLTLAKDGKTNYKIVFDKNNSILPENTAKDELKTYLKKLTKADFPVVDTANTVGKCIIVGHNKLSEKFLGRKVIEKLGDEEFIIKSSKDGNIYIVGGRPRGTLYGVYHFLDNILGVRWLAPDAEFIPDKSNLEISALDLREKPAYNLREPNLFIHTNPEADYIWQVRNRFNYTAYDSSRSKRQLKEKYWLNHWGIKNVNVIELPYQKYGIKTMLSSVGFAHTIHALIPDKKYFKQHPEWWEEIDGKRVNNGVASAMCLSNEELIAEVAKNAISDIDKDPTCNTVAISENDCIASYCTCLKCRALIKKFGNAESGLLIYFVNRVAEKIHKKYPDIMIETLAYIRTENPPKNIKVGKNIIVRLCAWFIPHGIPYGAPKNTKGKLLLNKLKEWSKICPNMAVWDYATSYWISLIPHPNLHTIIPNLKYFHQAGVKKYFYEGDHSQGGYRSGESLARAFLMSRGLWNPNADSDELLNDFTNAYYGKQAGKYVSKYWKLLRETNSKANYIDITQGGNVGKAPYLELSVVLAADKLLKTAMQAAGNKEHKERVEQLHMMIDYTLLYNWREYEKEANEWLLKMPGTFETTLADFEKNANQYGVREINIKPKKEIFAKLKKYYYLDFSATASKCYNSKPADAFDDNLKTAWNGGDFSGWLEIKFKKPKRISSIYSIFYQNDIKVDYMIEGSLDGKKWFPLVPRRTVKTRKIIQDIDAHKPTMYANDKFKSREVAYVKTTIFRATMPNMKQNSVVIREQKIK